MTIRSHSVPWAPALGCVALAMACGSGEAVRSADSVPDIPPAAVVPSPEQLAYQQMELIGFVHFTVNTFTDREWGFGDESPAIFAPTVLDADQWARIAAEVGMRELILTAKHHDGFALRAFRRILDDTFATDVAAGKPVRVVANDVEVERRGDAIAPESAARLPEPGDDEVAGRHRAGHPKFAPGNIVNGDPDSYWATEDNVASATLEIDLGAPRRFDRIRLQEPIRFGQRIAGFAVEVRVDGGWREIARATTVGYKRLLRIDAVTADRVRLVIEESVETPVALASFGLYRAAPDERRD
jgi:alpha-L-fucosidase